MFAQNVFFKILAVVAMALPIVALTGFFYSRVAGKSLTESMFTTYTVLQDTPGAQRQPADRAVATGTQDRAEAHKAAACRASPTRAVDVSARQHRHCSTAQYAGADACCEDTPRASFVLNMTHVIGLFTYALVLGIVADDVQSTVEGFKAGNTAIVERGHTVVLNANRTSESLLRQVRDMLGPHRRCTLPLLHHVTCGCPRAVGQGAGRARLAHADCSSGRSAQGGAGCDGEHHSRRDRPRHHGTRGAAIQPG